MRAPSRWREIILKWAEAIAPRGSDRAPLIANSPAAALALADDLARLMDDMATRQVSWDRLDKLVPDEMDKYWEHTLDFLKIHRPHWRRILEGKELHRAGRTPRQADRGRSQAACRPAPAR